MNATSAEIASQPDVWARAAEELTASAARELAAPGERMLILGCGTSWFVAQSLAELRESAQLGETDAVCASEFRPRRRYDRVVAVTRSGTSTEVLEALRQVPSGAHRVAITAVENEPVDDLTDTRILLDFADERSVVQTRFPTTVLALARATFQHASETPDLAQAQAALSTADSLNLAQPRDVRLNAASPPQNARFSPESLVADGLEALTLTLPADPADIDHLVFLGTGWTVGLAHEAALKVREAAQAHSESYPAMDFRHGPVAVAGPRSLVWSLGDVPPELDDVARGAGATTYRNDLDPLAQLLLVQRFALALAAHRGLDPDNPRLLTRSVVLT
ncbi:SIS domain-containing protein [Paractinoplanes lichenicola]|uniref:Glutamine--fructose-6-phosphate aminotransferase [isomerizing] n=1 Tax=Paractinoplanes lichenicola TaxID=2802976 RepID=A0ABS1VYU4_9ACTN|nr:SIS domain-containing protein [Actinoplanes lichenicola]MBL7259661.1 SIS domain-containing protein [Actinoplanes lichenicola]